MSYINLIDELKINIAKIINIRDNNSFVFPVEKRVEFTAKTTEFYNYFQNLNRDYNRFVRRYQTKRKQDSKNINLTIKNLKNRHAEKQTNITNIHDEEIPKIKKQISNHKARLTQSLKDSEENYLQNVKLLKESLSTIDSALALNLSFYDNIHTSSENNYSYMINKANFTSQKQIEKLHAENSRSTVIADEKDNERLLQIRNQINDLQLKIQSVEEELAQKQDAIKSKILSESVILNNHIRDLTSAKNRKNYLEKDKNNIKISDLQNQENIYTNAYNKKNKKIMEDFAKTLADLDSEDEKLKVDFQSKLENYTRTHYYSYYACLQELNDFINKQNRIESSETRSVKKAKNRLYKLKVESYYDKLERLKSDYLNQKELFEENYNFNVKKIKIEKNLAEINKDYELEVADLEFESQKASIKLLFDFVTKQGKNRTSTIDLEFEKEANNSRYISLRNVENLQSEYDRLTIDYQIKVTKIKNEVELLEHDYKLIDNLANIRRERDLNISETYSKLERVTTMLELDKNKLLNSYNLSQVEFQKNIAKNIATRNKLLIREKIDYILQSENANKNMLFTEFSNLEAPLNFQISLHHFKKQKEHRLENIQFQKNLSLAKLTDLRKKYRYEALSISQIGNFISNILTYSTTYTNNLLTILNKCEFLAEDALATIWYEFLLVVQNFQLKIIDAFTGFANRVIKKRIQDLENNVLDNQHNSNLEKYQQEKNKLTNNIIHIQDAIDKYESTLENLKETETKVIVALRQKRNKLSVVKRITSIDLYQLKQQLKETKNNYQKICGKQAYFQKLLKENKNKLELLDKKFKFEDRFFDKQRKRQIEAYNMLAKKILQYKKYFSKRINSIYRISWQNNPQKYLADSLALISRVERSISRTTKNFKNVFTSFKDTNEKQFDKTKKAIMVSFRKELKTTILVSKRDFRLLQHRYNLKHTNLNHETNLCIKQKKNVEKLHIANNNYIQAENAKTMQVIKQDFKLTTQKFHYDIWAISNNIQYLINNAKTLAKNTTANYWHNYYTLTSNTTSSKKEIINNAVSYIKRKQNDLINLPEIKKKNIAEIKKQNQEKNSTVELTKEENKREIIELRKKYQIERLKIITNNTKKLLNERINHNKSVHQLKRTLENEK